MKLEARIREARGLCGDIERDLSQVESLRGAGHAERSLEYLANIQHVLLDELHGHVQALAEHYDRQAGKAGAK